MSKMAPLIGRSSTERLFLGRFAALCTDPVFYVRKVCAANFGEFCAVVGTDATENVLVSTWIYARANSKDVRQICYLTDLHSVLQRWCLRILCLQHRICFQLVA